MSYRTFKKLMGETSLERKCRFLFGGGLMILLTGSFYFYARLNSSLVEEQTREIARGLVGPTLIKTHWRIDGTGSPMKDIPGADRSFSRNPAAYFHPENSIPYEAKLFRVDTDAPGEKRLGDVADIQAVALIRDPDNEVNEVSAIRTVDDSETYWYLAGIRGTKSCVSCHYHDQAGQKEGELIGVARIGIPLKETNRALKANNMILLAMAIVTAFLAMLAAYVIVRYVIVKPVLHLKDVSDGIARGTLDLRADIRTGDEFEELSHAFNRMLRHLVTVQDELRGVNSDLDGKVDELAQVNLQLYEMNKLKDEFLATMSHELRTPLNSILGFSDILAKAENLNDRQRRYLQNIRNSGEDLMTRINDVLDLAKIESGKMDLQAVEFSLGDLVDRQVSSLMPMAEKKNIDFTSDISRSIPPLEQDPGKVQQILMNLLSNAIKFTPEGGRVRISADMVPGRSDELLIIVEDTGIGIRLEEQETIFEKFRQGKLAPGQKDTLTREYGGTGLGLSIVKELSKLLGGEVALDSEFGKGSTFTVRLPVKLPMPSNEITEAVPEEFWDGSDASTQNGHPDEARAPNEPAA